MMKWRLCDWSYENNERMLTMIEGYKDQGHKEDSDYSDHNRSIQDENRLLYYIMPIVGAVVLGVWIVIVLVVLSAMKD